ncbi:MAG: hypothetical protein WBD31_27920 [Rubripirellula sp.]
MTSLYTVVQVDRVWALDVEPVGAKRKFWYRPGGVADGDKWLFKADERIAGNQDRIGTGEDWAEKVACEICSLLGIPHIKYELAVEVQSGVPGSVSRNFAAAPNVLVLGNQLMLERDPACPAHNAQKYKAREHTVDAVLETVAKLQPPPTKFCQRLPDGIVSASDVFVGYVMLDALIANQDRHHQNWGALRSEQVTQLAPTFDHGASLARNEPDVTRAKRLHGSDPGFGIVPFSEKARSSFYDGGKKTLKTYAAFQAMADRKPDAAKRWLSRLSELSEIDFQSILDSIPAERMTAIAREFTLKLILVNLNRLLRV